jgi:hypothetical protein
MSARCPFSPQLPTYRRTALSVAKGQQQTIHRVTHLADSGERGHIASMMDKRPKATHNPSQRSTQRWDNEGGAIKNARAKRPSDPAQLKARDKAADLAGKIIDRHADRSATSEERESRKRRLLKGPKEFRNLRRDQSKTKP